MCDQVIIFGTDVPGLKQEAFEAAVCLLDSHDLVFGPARDGGYYMVGMKHPHAAIFQNVDWSTPAVLSASVAIAQHHRLAVPVPLGLPQLIDIDVVKVRPMHACCFEHIHSCGLPCTQFLHREATCLFVKDLKGWVQECSEAEMATPIWTAAHQLKSVEYE